MSNKDKTQTEGEVVGIPNLRSHEKAIEEHLKRIEQEFRAGFEFLEKYPRSITIFGSSMASPDSIYYQHAYEVTKKITSELKYAIVTGGGPGIMEAAAKGATEAGGQSLGLRINLVREKTKNEFTSDGLNFTYFFARKTMLAFAAEAYIFFPGGFGTFDELFSILTLIQTNKIPRVPIILYESSFWEPLREFMKRNMTGERRTLNDSDFGLFEITDDADRIIEIIRKSPVSEWWRHIN